MTALEKLGAFAAAGIRGRVTGDLQELLALHVVDTVAAWVAAASTAEARQLEDFRAKPRGTTPDPVLDVAVNCAKVRLSEADDIHLAAMITPGSIVVPAALTIAASLRDADAGALREAMVAGYETMIRLGIAIDGPKILYRGIWPAYFAAGFGVAAVASRLLNLSEQQTSHALALALTMTPAGVGSQNAPTTSRWLAIGAAARNGLLAAQAAQAGFTSDLGILDGKFLGGVYDITPDVAALTDGLGERICLREVSFKPWCAARQTMAATQALKEMIADGLDVAGITTIDVACPPPFLRMIDHGIADGDRFSRLTSVQYQLASAALQPNAAYDISGAGDVAPAVRALMAKIKVSADESLMPGFPVAWQAAVDVHVGQKVVRKKLAQIPGDPARPFGEREVTGKFHTLADGLIGASHVEQLIAATRRMLDGGMTPAHLLAAIGDATAGSIAR